jgi:general nucleoside transport system permease protein
MIRALFSATLLAQTLRMSVPYACAAIGGVWSERSGIVNVALEGILLAGGLGGVVSQLATGSGWAGVAAGAIVGAAMGALHGVIVVWGRVDAIVSGLAINLGAAGGTRFVLRFLYDSSSNSPPVRGFRIGAPGVLAPAGGAELLARTLLDPLTLVTVAIVAWTAWMLMRTRFGLRVRACGEDPAAAASVGVDPARVRVTAVTLGGAIAGLGGVALAYDQHQFQSGMSGGRGFIALAAVILSGWRPVRAAAACLGFAALDAAQIVLQNEQPDAGYWAQMLPYVATLVVLWGVAARRGAGAIAGRTPKGLGKAVKPEPSA